jgi:hypothetical protein
VAQIIVQTSVLIKINRQEHNNTTGASKDTPLRRCNQKQTL